MLTETIKNIIDQYKHIGVFVSGGFDSGLLLYMLAKLRTNNDIKIFIVNRHPNSVEHARPVIDYVSSAFNYQFSEHTIEGANLGEYAVQIATTVALAKYDLDVVLVGCVKPPEHISSEFTPLKSIFKKIQQPFYDVTKDVLVQEAKDLDALELLEVSNSCELSYKKPCMECFHCLEKDWAIKKVFNTP